MVLAAKPFADTRSLRWRPGRYRHTLQNPGNFRSLPRTINQGSSSSSRVKYWSQDSTTWLPRPPLATSARIFLFFRRERVRLRIKLRGLDPGSRNLALEVQRLWGDIHGLLADCDRAFRNPVRSAVKRRPLVCSEWDGIQALQAQAPSAFYNIGASTDTNCQSGGRILAAPRNRARGQSTEVCACVENKAPSECCGQPK